MRNQSLRGPINMTAPRPVTNADFTRLVARTIKRPALLPVPAAALKLIFGEFAREGLLSSTKVFPSKLSGDGFQFTYPELGGALANLLRGA
jgi:NAD dependent epimerase/dehydratase family enzyme